MKLREKVEKSMLQQKFNGMHEALLRQLSSPEFENMGFLERLDDLLIHEQNAIENKRIAYLLKQAKLRWPHACIEKIKYELLPSLKPNRVNELAELSWVRNRHHVIITGLTGAGKTYIACALSNKAIHALVPVLFFRFRDLILHLEAADKNDKLVAFKRRINRTPVLLIDDWGVSPLSSNQRHLLFELIESRDRKGSIIITSQYSVQSWYEAFQDPIIADATLDRIVHQSHEINLNEDSIRKAMGLRGDVE